MISSHEASSDWSTWVAHSWRTGRAAVDAVCVVCTTPTMRYPSGVAGTSGRTTGVRSVDAAAARVSPVDRAAVGRRAVGQHAGADDDRGDAGDGHRDDPPATCPPRGAGRVGRRRVRGRRRRARCGLERARVVGRQHLDDLGRPRLAMDGAPPASGADDADAYVLAASRRQQVAGTR